MVTTKVYRRPITLWNSVYEFVICCYVAITELNYLVVSSFTALKTYKSCQFLFFLASKKTLTWIKEIFDIFALRALLASAVITVKSRLQHRAMVPHLPTAGVQHVGGGAAVAGETIGLIGPGTGLRGIGFVWVQGNSTPLRSEGGHATFAPLSELEWAIACWLERDYRPCSCRGCCPGRVWSICIECWRNGPPRRPGT